MTQQTLADRIEIGEGLQGWEETPQRFEDQYYHEQFLEIVEANGLEEVLGAVVTSERILRHKERVNEDSEGRKKASLFHAMGVGNIAANQILRNDTKDARELWLPVALTGVGHDNGENARKQDRPFYITWMQVVGGYEIKDIKNHLAVTNTGAYIYEPENLTEIEMKRIIYSDFRTSYLRSGPTPIIAATADLMHNVQVDAMDMSLVEESKRAAKMVKRYWQIEHEGCHIRFLIENFPKLVQVDFLREKLSELQGLDEATGIDWDKALVPYNKILSKAA